MSKRLLIANSETVILYVLRQRLESFGYEVETVTNGRDALDRLQHTAFDGLLLTTRMPGANGLEVLRQVRGTHSPVPIVMMTGYPPDADEARRGGANDFLMMPFDFETLKLTAERYFGVP